MLSPCTIYGALPISSLSVHVVNTSPLSMLSVGGFPSMQHNEIRDLTASLLRETSSNVGIEPGLQRVTTKVMAHRSVIVQDDAQFDIRAQGFWGERHQEAFFNVRVFNPHAPSNRSSSLAAWYRKHDKEKRRKYKQRVKDIEFGLFIPPVFSAMVEWAELQW